ncbi:dATP/dGTP diphosphohydrolase domain-containing protein [Aliarcobacter butzleri]|uniref:dATP/dGTP diphosphohydrolase domain-containing protein n=1 Tax=Aliarcobacter butzleri TaxID=28197 RepID=UPI003AFA8048
MNDKDEFIKNDTEKVNIAILFDMPLAVAEVAKVIDYGAKKYDRKNWALVDDKERYESASLRHQISFHNGEYLDEESGLQHLAHSIASQLFLLELKLREKNVQHNS